MDVLAVYGCTIAGAVICLVASLIACSLWVMGEIGRERDYTGPRPWETVAIVATLALPAIAFVGAAALIGPSSDEVNFVRAVGGS